MKMELTHDCEVEPLDQLILVRRFGEGEDEDIEVCITNGVGEEEKSCTVYIKPDDLRMLAIKIC